MTQGIPYAATATLYSAATGATPSVITFASFSTLSVVCTD